MTIRIAIAAPPRGQFVQLALMPRSTPPLLIGDRAWVRRIREMPSSSLYAIEAWGESTSIAPGGMSLAVTTADPASDVPAALWPTIEPIAGAFAKASANVNGDPAQNLGQLTELRTDWSGIRLGKAIITPRVRVEALLSVPCRSPWAYVSIAASRLEDTADPLTVVFDIPGWKRIPIAVPLIGAVGRERYIIEAQYVAGESEEVTLARANAPAFLHHAIAEHWTGDFMGWPVIASPFTIEQARERAPALRAPANPNEPGIRGFYSVTLTPLIWCRNGVCLDALRTILEVAEQWLDRQATWFLRDGSEIEPWPARTNLTFHNSKPWIDDRSDPYDDLGYGKPRGSSWTADALLEHDDQHENCELLAIAACATIDPAFEIAARTKLVALTYQRSWVGHLDGSWSWPPFGRTAARPWLALLALAGVSVYARETAERVSASWGGAMLRGIRARGIPRAKPVQVAGLQPGPLFAGYEEGLIAAAALRTFRLFGDREYLEIAYRCGRTVATTMYWQADGLGLAFLWAVGYEVPFRGDGVPVLSGDGVVLAGRDLATWSVGGLNAFLAARVAMHTLGIAGEADDATWIEIAMSSRAELTRDLALDSHAQSIVRVNQTLWDVDIATLATPVPPT